MIQPANQPRSTPYTLRLWPEVLDQMHWEWRGELKDLGTGEVRYFRSWSEIVELLAEMLDRPTDSLDTYFFTPLLKGEDT